MRERLGATLKLIEYTVGAAKQPIFNDAKDFKKYTLEEIAGIVKQQDPVTETTEGTLPN